MLPKSTFSIDNLLTSTNSADEASRRVAPSTPNMPPSTSSLSRSKSEPLNLATESSSLSPSSKFDKSSDFEDISESDEEENSTESEKGKSTDETPKQFTANHLLPPFFNPMTFRGARQLCSDMYSEAKLNGLLPSEYTERVCHLIKSIQQAQHQAIQQQQQQMAFPFPPSFDLSLFRQQMPPPRLMPHIEPTKPLMAPHLYSSWPMGHPGAPPPPLRHPLPAPEKVTTNNLSTQPLHVDVHSTCKTNEEIDVDELDDEDDNLQSPSPTEKSTEDTDGSSKDNKRRRTSFTSKQLLELEREFITKKYLSLGERAELARTLRLSQEQIKVWFQNRRAKWKRAKGYRGGPSAGDQENQGAGSGGGGGAKTICSSSTAGGSTHKIYVPIPVHVDRVKLRSQQQQIEKRMSSALSNRKKFGDPQGFAASTAMQTSSFLPLSTPIIAPRSALPLESTQISPSTATSPHSISAYSTHPFANSNHLPSTQHPSAPDLSSQPVPLARSELLPSLNSAFQVPVRANNILHRIIPRLGSCLNN